MARIPNTDVRENTRNMTPGPLGTGGDAASPDNSLVPVDTRGTTGLNDATDNTQGILDTARANEQNLEAERSNICAEIRKRIKRTEELLRQLQDDIRDNNRAFDEWAKESETAADAALKASVELLSSGIIADVGQVIDDEIKMIPDLTERMRLERLKDAIDSCKSKIDIIYRASELANKPDFKKALDVVVNMLDDPTAKKLLKTSDAFAKGFGPLVNLLKFASEYSYQAVRFGVSWSRINQLDKNSDRFLEAVKVLSEQMKKDVEALKRYQCNAVAVR